HGSWSGRSGKCRRSPNVRSSAPRPPRATANRGSWPWWIHGSGRARRIAADSPALGWSAVLHLYDTATGEVRELALRAPNRGSIYLCGPTAYGPPHLGHGRATLVYDILRRYLEWRGLTVRLVSNVTDIDDKIIDRASTEHRDWHDIATKCEAVWWRSMDAIGV